MYDAYQVVMSFVQYFTDTLLWQNFWWAPKKRPNYVKSDSKTHGRHRIGILQKKIEW